MQKQPMNEALLPIWWLIGKWKSIVAHGQYPTIQPFSYCEEMEFKSFGQPLLRYTSKTWHPKEKRPMHFECGFLRVKPFTKRVAFLLAHNFGVTSVEEGCISGAYIDLKTTNIGSMGFVREPKVLDIRRSYKFNPDTKKLEMVICMATSNTPLTEHLNVCYEKIEEGDKCNKMI